MTLSTAPGKKRGSGEAPTTIANPLLDEEMRLRLGRRCLDLRGGQVVAGCEVVRLIGRGGLSSVYQVWNYDWGVDMALKLPQAATLDSLTEEAFRREAMAWLLPAQHPQVAACYFVENILGRPGIFMEYVEGQNLAALMEMGGGPLYLGGRDQALARLLDIMIQAARGLGYIHSLGLHSVDMKPANLLFTAGGRLVLADFATLTDSAERPAATHQYYSPEAAENKAFGKPADLWALALSGLECFLGRRPWESGSMVGYALDTYFKEQCAVSPPPLLVAFFHKALAHEPTERYQSATAMDGALLDIYRRLCGREYPRPALGPLPESAERLNNKAFSYQELGRPDIAEELAGDQRVRRPSKISPVKWF